MVQGMVRYVDGAGLPLSDWAEDEADALAQAIQRGRGALAEKLLRDHFVAAARADTAMQGNDAAQMLRMAQEREALVNQLVDAGYTQAEIGANSLGLPLEEFNRLVKEGIYSRERGAPDSLFPKRSNSRKAAAGPAQQGSVQSGGKQSAAAGAQGQAPQTAVARPDGWRKSMLKAGPVAKAMGIETRGKRLAQVVAEIDAADAQRAGVQQDGADLSAGKIDREWSAFAPETGTLGVPRAEMPQIRAAHRGALVNFLKARGIDSRAGEMPANDLKPTQAEFSPAKVEKARAFPGGDRSILVSSDGYVVDGHHQWLARRANGEPVKVIRLQAPIREVLAQAAEFPSVAAASGAQSTQGAPDAASPRNLRLADERAPGAADPAQDGAGGPGAGAAPAVGTGQRAGGGTAKPGAAVRTAVPDAGGAGESAGGVVGEGADRPAKAAATEPVAQPITRADVEDAQQQARADNRKKVKQGASEASPIEDAGEKIGGARKDRWKERGLNLDDLDAMTEAEGAELATKANVWKPDYEALSAAAEPVTAAMVKTIYDQLAAKPKKNTPEGRRQYVQMMRIVRDVYTEANGPEAVKNAYLEIRKRAGLNTADPLAKSIARELLFSVYKGRSDPFVLGYTEMSKAKKLVEDGFPAKADPWKSRLSVSRMDGGPGTTERGIEMYMERSAEAGTPLTREQIEAGFFRVNTKDNKTVAYAPTKADAEAAAATVYERDMKGKKDGKPEPVRPNLDELKRENLPQRIDRDVTSEDFVRDLGFRGVEFGNWSAQDERQRILNMAYDGLMDLAEIMGVPPKAMSLNGTLGMAFGARGGGRFAAHYEPGKLVINMTKIRGGGSMAHEWAHAMDHYFGELDKADAYTTQARGASGWYSEDQYNGVPRTRHERVGNEWKAVEKRRLDNLRPEMAAAFDEVMRALFQKQITKAEMVRSQELDLERTEALARGEQDAEMKAMYQNMVQNKREALNELRNDPEGKLYAGRGRSDYASQAQALSGKSVDGYWVRPTEMFARAFESWVFDRVTAMGARSDYLVHGVEEDRFAGGGYKGNPYPTGEERARINAAFDKLASTIKTKQTDKGMAMFSRSPAKARAQPKMSPELAQDLVSIRPRARATKDSVRAAVREVVNGLGLLPNGLGRIVVATSAEIKQDWEPLIGGVSMEAGGEAGNALGFFDPKTKTVFLIADHIRAGDELGVVVHELMHKHGQAVLGEAGWNQLHGAIGKWASAPEGSMERFVHDEAAARVRKSRPAGEARKEYSSQELFPYAVQVALEEGVRPNMLAKPGTVARWFAQVRAMLRQVWNKLSTKPDLFDTQDLVNLAFGIAQRENPEHAGALDGVTSDAGNALAALSRVDELFQIPKSQGKTVAEIAADVDPAIKVRRVPGLPGRQDYKLTMANGKTVSLMVAPTGLSRYQFDYVDGEATDSLIKRPGENPEDVPEGTGDVWIDVSALESGEGGREVYAIAANFAHNNGMIFIGDPAGFSDDAMTRRPEQMLSSALKFGTTAHLAPHPRQVSGDKRLGIPPLKWVYGDDLGNIRRLIDLNLKALDNAGYGDDSIRIDPDGGAFRDASGSTLDREAIRAISEAGFGRRSRAGGSTLARRAVLASLVRSEGQAQRGADGRPDGLLEDLLRLADQSLPSVKGLFYSRSVAEGDAAQRAGDAIKAVSATNLKQRADWKATDYLGLGLQTLGRRQIVDIYGDALPLAQYNKLAAQMEADKNEVGANADKLATAWGKLKDERQLAELMHDATLAQMDPAKEHVPGDDQMRYKMLRARFNALTPEAKQVYLDARSAYQTHHANVRQAIKDRIERSELKGERKAALLKQMDDEFFKAVKGVYFPLARFGQYVVVVKDADGKVASVNRAETMAEAQALRTSLLKAFPAGSGHTVARPILGKEFIAGRDAVGRGFMTELYAVLDKQDMDAAARAELEDTLGQLYLSSLPDLSWAKHGIHRKGTPGFSQDARRAFAQNMFHGARYLAKLRYSDLMQDELNAMQQHVDDWKEVEDFDQPKAQRVVDEMNKRHESLMNPKSNPLSTALTSFGFIFHLGLSPASAMVNLSQTALVAYPIMGAKWGFGKASAALLKASGEAARGRNDITGALTAQERQAYDEAVRTGVIDVTMAHDLAGISQGEDAGVMWKLRPVMKWASFMFHHAERFNRQVTFVAAYRLAREAGASHQSAYEQAADATYKGHFDYSASNRARIMQGNTARVLLLFKQYSQNMIYTLARSAHQSLKGATPEARAEARKTLGGLLTMHAAAAGVLGLPMVTTLLAAASMLGGDDDEPWDAQVALQNLLADTFGQKSAEVLAHGLSRLTPWDVSGRVGLDRLIFPDVQEGMEGQRLAESAMTAALGPVAGIGVNVLKGVQEMSQGRYLRGLEAMAPSVARGPLKAWRYESEGVKDKTGIVVQDEVDAAALWGQVAGFSPSDVRRSYEGKSAIVQHDRALQARRSALVEQFAMAAMAGDEAGKTEAREAIAKFNEKNPARRILPLNLMQSVAQRQKRIREAKEGVYLPAKRRDAMEQGRFALAQGAPV